MKLALLVLLGINLAAEGLTVDGRLKGDVAVNPWKMQIGESACVFPWHWTQEGNIWIGPNAVYRRTDDETCIYTLRKVSDHAWTLDLKGNDKHRPMDDTDAELEHLGMLKLGPAKEVLK